MKVNSVCTMSSLPASEPYYAQPVSPPRPVSQPRPVLPSKNNTLTKVQVEMRDPIPVISREPSVASINKTVPLSPKPFRQQAVKPDKPVSPKRFCFSSSSSSCSSDDTPPPRPKSPEFLFPSSRSNSSHSNNQMQNISRRSFHVGSSRNSSSGDSCDLSEMVSARLGYQRPPSSQDMSRPQSRSRFIDSRSTTPQLSKQNSFNNFGMFSPHSRNSYNENFSNKFGFSPEFLDDSDYGAYQISRDFIRTPSLLDERSFSRLGSNSFFDENDYSAFTPDLRQQRKMSFSSSVCSTPLQTPKLNRDFGFVSSKKDVMPKPPRRRSKDPGNGSRPVSRQHRSSSRETTPVNNPKSPVRPSRVRAGKNYPAAATPNTQNKLETNKSHRPRSLQETAQEPIYEILSPVSQTINSNRSNKVQRNKSNLSRYSSSSDSESDFKTPQASPRFVRSSNKSKKVDQRNSDIYEEIEIGSQSYQNMKDNPVLNVKKIKPVPVVKKTVTTETKVQPCKPKMIPPRTSQDPIPTPRKSSLSRSRDQSVESLNSLNSLPRKIYPKKTAEPHYKVPPPNPRPVKPNESHFYSELLYEDDQEFNRNNTNNIKEIESNNKLSSDKVKQRKSFQESQKPVNQKQQRSNDKLSRKGVEMKQKHQNDYPSGERSQAKHKQNLAKNVKTDLETNSGKVVTAAAADANVKVELIGEEDKFYDAQEECGEFMVKKSKAIATLPDGSQYPCVIVQKKSKGDTTLHKESNEKKNDPPSTETLPPQKAPRTFKNYTPVDMKMKPDWFEDLKIKEETKTPQPTSIIEGVLYTSKALIDQEKDNLSKRKLNTFNLIKPEVFETYDVCRNVYKESAEQAKVKSINNVFVKTEVRILKVINAHQGPIMFYDSPLIKISISGL